MKDIIFTSKNHITSLGDENDTLIKKTHKLRKYILCVNFIFTPSENIDNKCVGCKELKNKFEDLHETFSKFVKLRGNLDMILSNKRGTYTKVGLDYLPESNTKSFDIF